MAAPSRITGADEPMWPDVREPRRPRHRRRWPWVGLAVLLVAGGAWLVVAHQHHRVVLADGLSCNSNRSRRLIIDYTWTNGPDSPDAAVDQLLSSAHGRGLPRSGYFRPGPPDADEVGGVTPSVQGFDYVHATHGHVDVGLRLEKSGGIWEVSEVEACA